MPAQKVCWWWAAPWPLCSTSTGCYSSLEVSGNTTKPSLGSLRQWVQSPPPMPPCCVLHTLSSHGRPCTLFLVVVCVLLCTPLSVRLCSVVNMCLLACLCLVPLHSCMFCEAIAGQGGCLLCAVDGCCLVLLVLLRHAQPVQHQKGCDAMLAPIPFQPYHVLVTCNEKQSSQCFCVLAAGSNTHSAAAHMRGHKLYTGHITVCLAVMRRLAKPHASQLL